MFKWKKSPDQRIIRILVLVILSLSGHFAAGAMVDLKLYDPAFYSSVNAGTGPTINYPFCNKFLGAVDIGGDAGNKFNTKKKIITYALTEKGSYLDGEELAWRIAKYEDQGHEIVAVFVYREEWLFGGTNQAFPEDPRILFPFEIRSIKTDIMQHIPALKCKDSVKIIQLLAKSNKIQDYSTKTLDYLNRNFNGVGLEVHIGDEKVRPDYLPAMASILNWNKKNGKTGMVFMGGGIDTYKDFPAMEKTYKALWLEMEDVGLKRNEDNLIYFRQGDRGIAGSSAEFFPENKVNTLLFQTSWLINAVSKTPGANRAPTISSIDVKLLPNTAGKSFELSVNAADPDPVGELNLEYSWKQTGGPLGAQANDINRPVFDSFATDQLIPLINGTHDAKKVTVSFKKAGNYIFQVTATDIGGLSATKTCTVTVTKQLTALAVIPAFASLTQGSHKQFSANGFDQFGDAMLVSANWTVSSMGGTITNAGDFSAGQTAAVGPFTITATSGAVSSIARVSITPGVNTGPKITTSPTAKLSSDKKHINLSVSAIDDGGLNGITYEWKEISGISPSPTFPVENGTFKGNSISVEGHCAGQYKFSVTIRDYAGLSVMMQTNVCQVDQWLSDFRISPALKGEVAYPATKPFTAIVQDQFGQTFGLKPKWSVFQPKGWNGNGTISSSQPTLSVDFIPSKTELGACFVQAEFTGPINIASSGRAKVSVVVLVVDPKTAFPVIIESPNPNIQLPLGQTNLELMAEANDNGGEAKLTYTWGPDLSLGSTNPQPAPTFSANGTHDAKKSTVDFKKAGAYRFMLTVSDGDGNKTKAYFKVSVQQKLKNISVSPHRASIVQNNSLQLRAITTDQFGDDISADFTWDIVSGGLNARLTPNPTNRLLATFIPEADSAGKTFTVRALFGSIVDYCDISVTPSANTAPVAGVMSVNNPTVTGTHTRLSITGSDDDGGKNGISYLWTSQPAAGVIFSPANGSIAGEIMPVTFSQPGVYKFGVTLTDLGGKVTKAPGTVTVTVTRSLTSLVVSAPKASVAVGEPLNCTLTALDQFSGLMTADSSWAVNGGGSISQNGVFSPTTSGDWIVSALSGSVQGTKSITVTAASAPTSAVAAELTQDAASTKAETAGGCGLGSGSIGLFAFSGFAFMCLRRRTNRDSK